MKKLGTFFEPGASELVISLRYCVSRAVIFDFKPRQLGGVLSFWTDSPEQRNQPKRASACNSLSLQPSVDRSKVCTPPERGRSFIFSRPFDFAHKSKGSNVNERWTSSFIGPGLVSGSGPFLGINAYVQSTSYEV